MNPPTVPPSPPQMRPQKGPPFRLKSPKMRAPSGFLGKSKKADRKTVKFPKMCHQNVSTKCVKEMVFFEISFARCQRIPLFERIFWTLPSKAFFWSNFSAKYPKSRPPPKRRPPWDYHQWTQKVVLGFYFGGISILAFQQFQMSSALSNSMRDI